jgi:large subunit ribosomal protein L25
VSALDIHDVIHVSGMTFPGNLKPIFDTDYPVVTVLPPTVAEAPVAAAAAEAAPAEGAEGAEGAAAAPAAGAAEAGAKEGAKGGAKEAAADKGGGQKKG